MPTNIFDFVIVIVIYVVIVEHISSDQIDIQMFSVLPSFVLRRQLPEKPLEDSQKAGGLPKLFVNYL